MHPKVNFRVPTILQIFGISGNTRHPILFGSRIILPLHVFALCFLDPVGLHFFFITSFTAPTYLPFSFENDKFKAFGLAFMAFVIIYATAFSLFELCLLPALDFPVFYPIRVTVRVSEYTTSWSR